MLLCFLKQPENVILKNKNRKGVKIPLLTAGASLFEKIVMALNFGNVHNDIFDFQLMYTVTPTGTLMRQ